MRPRIPALLIAAALAITVSTPAWSTTEHGGPDDVTPTDATAEEVVDDSAVGPDGAPPMEIDDLADVPAQVLDQRYGMLEQDDELISGPAPAVVEHGVNALPPPQPGAEVYPRPANGIWPVTGGGFGHGVGMSQYGAHGAGLQGLTHQQILAFYYPGTDLQTWSNNSIRVGITINNNGITRVAQRSGLVVSNAPGSTTRTLPSGYDQFRVRATGTSASSCVLEGRNSAGNWQTTWPSGLNQACPITFSSTSESTVDLFLPSGERRIYRGAITATHRGTTSLLSVNHLPLQSYLRSVTLAEMPSSFHQQALRTQAVAARTYALAGSSATSHYDVCDTTACQAYRGRGVRNSNGTITSYEHSNTDAAVTATNGQVLTYVFSDGVRRLATTMYSSSTGGHTTRAPGAGHGYLVPQPDPYDAVQGNPRASWTGELTASALQSRYGIHNVQRVQILTRDGHGSWGGRVLDARVEGYTANGTYTWAYATGNGLAAARPWPQWNTGLSSNYFTLGAAQSATPVRVAGADRYATAAEIAQAWNPGVGVVYVVSGQNFSDAVIAAARSGVFDAPVLLTRSNEIPSATQAALTRLNPGRIVVVGGTTSVNNTVYNQLRGYTTTGDMQRVSGGDRYQLAAAMAAYYPSGGQRVYLVSGEAFADGLAASALAAHQEAPVLMTRSNRLDAATIAQLQRLNAAEVVVVGGTTTISNTVAQQARSYTRNNSMIRLAGDTRYDTMEAVARQFPAGRSPAYVASGQVYADALVGSALAGRRGVPIILTQGTRVPQATATALTRQAPSQMFVLGGTDTITNGTMGQLGQYIV